MFFAIPCLTPARVPGEPNDVLNNVASSSQRMGVQGSGAVK